MLLINVTVGVSDCRLEDYVRNTERLKEVEDMGSELPVYIDNGLKNVVSLYLSLEIARLIARIGVLMQVVKAIKLTQIRKVGSCVLALNRTQSGHKDLKAAVSSMILADVDGFQSE